MLNKGHGDMPEPISRSVRQGG